nr:MAG TPA: hypothetical protein [Caudoviricetes sp.]
MNNDRTYFRFVRLFYIGYVKASMGNGGKVR